MIVLCWGYAQNIQGFMSTAKTFVLSGLEDENFCFPSHKWMNTHFLSISDVEFSIYLGIHSPINLFCFCPTVQCVGPPRKRITKKSVEINDKRYTSMRFQLCSFMLYEITQTDLKRKTGFCGQNWISVISVY